MKQHAIVRKLAAIVKAVYFPLAALLASMLIGSVVILATAKTSPLQAYQFMLSGAFGSLKAWDETLVKAIPFMFTALSYSIARRCGIINLGAEGQFKMGALMASIVGISFQGLPPILHISLAILAGFIGGAVFGLIVAALKIKFGASELITTIMLNYIAIQIISYFVTGPIRDSANNAYPQTAQMAGSAQLPRLFGGGFRLHWGIVLVILAILFYYYFLWKTTKGFEMRVVGLNPTAGEYAGMSIQKSSMYAMLLAGGFAGLGGCVEIIAVQYRLMMTSFSITYGFTGIAVALMGSLNPLGIFFSSILFGGLQAGSLKMQTMTDVSSSVVLVIQALVIMFIAGRSMFQWKQRQKGKPLFKAPSDPTDINKTDILKDIPLESEEAPV